MRTLAIAAIVGLLGCAGLAHAAADKGVKKLKGQQGADPVRARYQAGKGGAKGKLVNKSEPAAPAADASKTPPKAEAGKPADAGKGAGKAAGGKGGGSKK